MIDKIVKCDQCGRRQDINFAMRDPDKKVYYLLSIGYVHNPNFQTFESPEQKKRVTGEHHFCMMDCLIEYLIGARREQKENWHGAEKI